MTKKSTIMNTKILKKTMTSLFLLTMGSVFAQVPQVYKKLGDNPLHLDSSAVLELESTVRGFLPPRMTMLQRDAIKPTSGLILWCSDCDDSTTPKNGQFCIYADSKWITYSPLTAATPTTPTLTTNKKGETNGPLKLGNDSAKFSGILTNTFGTAPAETGIVYKEIAANDFGALPLLDASGNVISPALKAMSVPVVTTVGGLISSDINLPSATRPYYFRTYAKSPSGSIAYGNNVIFNLAPPVFGTSVVTNDNTAAPKFATTLTINAGTTPKVTEYGYYSSTTNTSPTATDNPIILSDTAAVTALNNSLNSDTFIADPVINLAVNNYNVTTPGLTYFKFYVTIDGVTTPGAVGSFTAVTPPPVANAPTSYNKQ